MPLEQVLESAIRRLDESGVGSPRRNAEVLLMFTLGCDRAYLYAHPECELSPEETARYDEALKERARGVPSQYLTGHQEFWGLDLIVTSAVLIPRPETEHVVETVLELAADRGQAGAGLHIVDVGTGSGCIVLALASELPQAKFRAVDISLAALEIARINAARLQMAERVNFVQSDLLEDTESGVDFVVSNPPYVGESEAVQLEVRKYEPKQAVFAGPEGLDVIARLIPQAREHLKTGGWLVFEMGCSQEAAARNLLQDWPEVRTIADLQGLPRVMAARK